jgi:hypothetical protein
MHIQAADALVLKSEKDMDSANKSLENLERTVQQVEKMLIALNDHAETLKADDNLDLPEDDDIFF